MKRPTRLPTAEGGAAPSAPATDTASLILAAALERFATAGYDATSMRDLARAAGVQPASLYNHFDSKEAILWGLVRSTMTDLVALQDAALVSGSTLERFRGAFRSLVFFHATRSEAARVITRELRSLSPEHYAQIATERRLYASRIASLIEHGVAEGVFAPSDIGVTALAVVSLGTGVANWFRPDGPMTVDELCDTYAELGDRLVGAKTAKVARTPGRTSAAS